ncbi:hypothetical protein A2U01_0080476, partial [Trifolium medium]|nr:hypothetical protein [Trifolium medium]
QPLIGAVHPLNGELASGTEGDDCNYKENVPESPIGNPPLPPGAPMETVMAVLGNAINRRGQYMRERNMLLQAVEEARITRASTSRYRRRG